jgi:hypothetical protein
MSERLEGEVLLGQKLTGELYASRAAEAKTLREKEEAQMALDFSNQVWGGAGRGVQHHVYVAATGSARKVAPHAPCKQQHTVPLLNSAA